MDIAQMILDHMMNICESHGISVVGKTLEMDASTVFYILDTKGDRMYSVSIARSSGGGFDLEDIISLFDSTATFAKKEQKKCKQKEKNVFRKIVSGLLKFLR
jgi:hypothetical protein